MFSSLPVLAPGPFQGLSRAFVVINHADLPDANTAHSDSNTDLPDANTAHSDSNTAPEIVPRWPGTGPYTGPGPHESWIRGKEDIFRADCVTPRLTEVRLRFSGLRLPAFAF